MSIWNREKKEGESGNTPQDDLIAKFSAALDEKLAPIRQQVEQQASEVKSLTTKWNEIENAGAAEAEEARRRAAAAAEGELTPEQKAAKDRESLLALSVATNARITEGECVAELQRDFPKLVPEFLQMCANTDIRVKAQANYKQQCLQAIDGLIGREARKGGLRFQKQTEKFVIEDGGGRSDGKENPLSNGDYDWTDDRSGKTLTGTEQLAKLKLTPEDFKKMQEMGLV